MAIFFVPKKKPSRSFSLRFKDMKLHASTMIGWKKIRFLDNASMIIVCVDTFKGKGEWKPEL